MSSVAVFFVILVAYYCSVAANMEIGKSKREERRQKQGMEREETKSHRKTGAKLKQHDNAG